MITLRNVWESSSEAEKEMPLMINAFLNEQEPVRSQTVVKEYSDGKQVHPAVLSLSDLAPDQVK